MFGRLRLQIGRLFGIGIYLHWTFFLLPCWILYQFSQDDPAGLGLAVWAGLLTCIFGCVILHELGHALTARRFGIGTTDITLYPIGGVARLERMSDKPWEEFWIAIAGPAVNIAIVTVIAFLFAVGGVSALMMGLVIPEKIVLFFLILAVTNLMLAIFNMVPAFPMDGGRILRSLLSSRIGHLQATRIAAGIGVFAAIGLAILGILGSPPNYILVAIGIFVLFAGQQERMYVEWVHHQKKMKEMMEATPFSSPFFHKQADFSNGEVRPIEPVSGFAFRPNISVYVWDNDSETWVKESRPPGDSL